MNRLALALASCLFAASNANAQDAPDTPAPNPQAIADSIAQDVARLRGLPFKRPVGAETQTTERFARYVAGKIDEEVPPAIKRHYGAIVKTLGLYRGPAIEDVGALMSSVLVSQAGAYYDPQTQKFYVLMTRMPEPLQGALYAHELYHALQDQYFELDRYLDSARPAKANSDRALARQSVVEGEATYVMNLWALEKALGAVPPRAALAPVVALQTNLSIEQLREMVLQPQVAQALGADVQAAMRSSEEIPSFLMDQMIGAYLKGMAFVFAVQERGWPAVEKLYSEYPPQSTEQILHPEKWLAREAAVDFDWPDFAKVAALRNWELLDDDVLGEFRWRSVFKEQGLGDSAEAAAAGWGGDRYAVFKRKDSDAMLLLLRTTWDSANDAQQFAAAYRRALAVKYAGTSTPTRVVQDGANVSIVEGGAGANLDALLALVKSAKQRP